MTAIRVMIVDDSATMRAMLDQIVSADVDCQVVGVAAGVDGARHLLMSCRPDVMTLDLTMPGMDGLKFLQNMDIKEGPPIIVVSSRSKRGSLEAAQAIEAGATACFDKASLLSDVPGFLRDLKRATMTRGRTRCTGRLLPKNVDRAE